MRNILFLLIDCLRADAISGEKRRTVTPTIDRLMQRGTYFSQAISTTSTTTPSVASMLTGNYPAAHGIRALNGYKLDSKCVTFPQVLKKYGYNNYAMVTGPLSPISGLDRGFDEYEYREIRTYLSDEWGEKLRQKFRRRELREPWFAFVHFWEIHYPIKVGKEFDSKRFGNDLYERGVSSLDADLLRLLELVGDDTIIIVHGDHGESRELLQHNFLSRLHRLKARLGFSVPPRLYRTGHGFHIYDFLIRVPLLFVGQDIFPAGKVITDQVRQIDFSPTLLDALGFDLPSPVDGRSLVPLLRDKAVREEPALVEAVGTRVPNPKNRRLGIRSAGWKYVFTPQNAAFPEELYDLQRDPDERRNLARSNPEKASGLRRQLLDIVSENESGANATGGEKMSQEEHDAMEERLKKLGYL